MVIGVFSSSFITPVEAKPPLAIEQISRNPIPQHPKLTELKKHQLREAFNTLYFKEAKSLGWQKVESKFLDNPMEIPAADKIQVKPFPAKSDGEEWIIPLEGSSNPMHCYLSNQISEQHILNDYRKNLSNQKFTLIPGFSEKAFEAPKAKSLTEEVIALKQEGINFAMVTVKVKKLVFGENKGRTPKFFTCAHTGAGYYNTFHAVSNNIVKQFL